MQHWTYNIGRTTLDVQHWTYNGTRAEPSRGYNSAVHGYPDFVFPLAFNLIHLSWYGLFALNHPSSEPIQRSRLLPRISFRGIFALMTAGAVFAAIARAAGNGAVVATGLVVGVGFLAAVFVIFLVLFLVAWVASIAWYEPQDEASPNWNTENSLPPQILPPREQRP